MELFEFINLFLNFKSQKFDELFYMEVEKMPKVKEKEVLNSFEKFLFSKGEKDGLEKVVLNGNKKGYSNETISDLTGLSIKEIEEILIQKEENAKS